MSDDWFKRSLLVTLDSLLEADGFANVTKAQHNMVDGGVYQKRDYKFELLLGGYDFHPANGKKMVGSTMNFNLDEIVPEEVSDNDYWTALNMAINEINKGLSIAGFKVDKFVAHHLNGRRSLRASNVRILYAEDSNPDDVAKAIFTVQQKLYQTMSRYAVPTIVPS